MRADRRYPAAGTRGITYARGGIRNALLTPPNPPPLLVSCPSGSPPSMCPGAVWAALVRLVSGSARAAGVTAWLAAAQACGTDNEPTEAARPELAATPAPRPEEPSELPSELIAWTPFCAAVCTAWAAAAGAGNGGAGGNGGDGGPSQGGGNPGFGGDGGTGGPGGVGVPDGIGGANGAQGKHG